jgi:5-methylcytosine-specific restriction enzyme subunit McrC
MVGAIRVGDHDLVVQPKARFASLLFMLAYAKDPGFRPAEFDGLPEDDVWPAVGETLVRLAGRALEHGALRGYTTKDNRLPVVKGRIRITDQITRHQGFPTPMEVRYSEFSIDTPENRLLRAALRRMAAVARLSDGILRKLHHLERELTGSSPLIPGAPRPAWSPNRLNQAYVPALRLAELILDSVGLTTMEGEQPVTSFVIDMAKAFEDFIAVALREALASLNIGLTREQYATHLDDDKRFVIRPDVVHLVSGQARAVYDAKYKLEAKHGDLYQMHTYCTVLGLETGHLVYAGSLGGCDTTDTVIRNSAVTIRIHPLDVTASPSQLLAQVHKIAKTSLSVPDCHPA